jgi:hypothetical protein
MKPQSRTARGAVGFHLADRIATIEKQDESGGDMDRMTSS